VVRRKCHQPGWVGLRSGRIVRFAAHGLEPRNDFVTRKVSLACLARLPRH